MAIIAQIPWSDGNGNIVISSVENKPNIFAISSSVVNEEIDREQEITFQTTNTKGAKASVKLKVKQLGKRELFITADNQIFVDSNDNNFAVLK